jgi:hypothetical protein
MATKKLTKTASTKTARPVKAVKLPITSPREFRGALAALIGSDGGRKGEGKNPWSYGNESGLTYAVPPRGTRRTTLEAFASQLGAAIAPVRGRPAIVLDLSPKVPVKPMVTFENVRDSAFYYIRFGGVGCSVVGWKAFLDANRTSAVVVPEQEAATTAQLNALCQLMGGGSPQTVTLPRGGGQRVCIVVGVAYTEP